MRRGCPRFKMGIKIKICKECGKRNRNSNPNFCGQVCYKNYYQTMLNKISKKETELKELRKELKELKYREYILDDKEINLRHKSGESINSISNVFGVSRETIKRRLNKPKT